MADTRYIRLVDRIKEYNPGLDEKLLNKGYTLAKTAHTGQLRASGEPFVTHPLEVAYILADMEMDLSTIVAALLHDTVEDTTSTIEQIKEEFGEEIAMLVDGVTKLSKFNFASKEEQQAENLRKMLLAMAKDIRVIVIKLADRLHNMRTLRYKSEGKQLEKARETMDIYAPLAHRLGISKIKFELEDLSLWYLDPEGYYQLVDSIAAKRREREEFIENIKSDLKTKINAIGIKNINVDGRAKHFYSIYRKMKTQNKTIDQIYDLFAFRIITDTVKDCYAILGLVHEMYKPMPGRFKDYIAMPKPNMYQSLHTTVMGPEGNLFEVQIRTWEMHKVSEVGIAAHWKYKENISGVTKEDQVDNKLAWVRELLEHQKDSNNASEFMETLKIDLFTDEVFVFTPNGDVINLRKGACPVDFAYAIHSAIGNKMVGAKVNGRMVPINYQLNNGDICEVLTSPNSHGPSKDWLKFINSSQAKNKINAWFKKKNRDANIETGKEAVEKELKRIGIPLASFYKGSLVDTVTSKYRFNSLDDMLAAIGFGGITAQKVILRFKEEYRKTLTEEQRIAFDEANKAKQELRPASDKTDNSVHKNRKNENSVIVKGIDNCMIKLSKCCNPVPGDEIIGFVTRGHGVSVHRSDCINILNDEQMQQRLIEVWWNTRDKVQSTFICNFIVKADDRNGLIVDITNAINDLHLKVKGFSAKVTDDQQAIMNLNVELANAKELDRVIVKLENIESVYEVKRANN